MTIEDVKAALAAALSTGEGTSKDLDDLLTQAKRDIEQIQQEEKERAAAEQKAKEQEKKQRGNEVAAMANRVLTDTATDADVAMVLTAYLHGKGIKDIQVDPSVVDVAFSMSEEDWANIEKLVEKIAKMDILTSNIFGAQPCESSVDVTKTADKLKQETSTQKETDFDKSVDKFLKELGIR